VAHAIFTERDLGGHRAWYAAQCRSALEAAASAGLEAITPEGAFYLCLRVGDTDTLAFAETLLEERDVIAIPGDIFGDSLRGWVRTSFVGPLDALREGYTRIAAHAVERAGLLPAG